MIVSAFAWLGSVSYRLCLPLCGWGLSRIVCVCLCVAGVCLELPRCLCVIQVSFCVAELVSGWPVSLFVLLASLFVGVEPALGGGSESAPGTLPCLAAAVRTELVSGWPVSLFVLSASLFVGAEPALGESESARGLCLVLPCLALSCLALLCFALLCFALPCRRAP